MEPQRQSEKASNEVFHLLGEQIAEAMSRHDVPGVAVGLIHEGQTHLAGFGVTNIEHPLAVHADTLFQIGSTTKTVTGTVAMRLVEMGKLDLDRPVRDYLPELRLADEEVASRVTLRHLFSHTGGWMGDYFDDTGIGDDALDRIVERVARLPQLTPLGEVWSYNNAGFYIAGRVLEVVSGMPYEALAKDLALEPLGMNMSFFFATDMMTYRVASGHTNLYEESEKLKVARPWGLARAGNPVGGIASTARDQMRYAQFHMGDGTVSGGIRLLAAESLAEMQRPHVAAADGNMFGVTWFLRDVGGTRIVRHGGATNGQMSAFMFAPDRSFALTILTNSDHGRLLNRDVTEWALRHYLGVSEQESETLELDNAQLSSYAGRYTTLMSDLTLEVKEGGLVMHVVSKGGFPTPDSPTQPNPPPVRVAMCGDDMMVLQDEPGKGTHGEFLRDAEGNIVWLRIGGRVCARER